MTEYTPFKMKGFSGFGNSPAKAKEVELTPEQKKKAAFVKMSKEHEGKPGFKEARDKAFGGETTVEGSKSTTHKPVEEEEKSEKTKRLR